MAGVAAANKYFGAMNIVGFSIDGATMVYVGQNYGAAKFERIKEGLRTVMRIAVISALTIAALTALFGREMIGLLITGDTTQTEAVKQIGYHNLLAISLCLPSLYLLLIYRSALQGMGNSTIPMLSGFVELALRVLSTLLLPTWIGVWGIYFAEGIGWVGAAILLTWSYFAVFKRREKAFVGISM